MHARPQVLGSFNSRSSPDRGLRQRLGAGIEGKVGGWWWGQEGKKGWAMPASTSEPWASGAAERKVGRRLRVQDNQKAEGRRGSL